MPACSCDQAQAAGTHVLEQEVPSCRATGGRRRSRCQQLRGWARSPAPCCRTRCPGWPRCCRRPRPRSRPDLHLRICSCLPRLHVGLCGRLHTMHLAALLRLNRAKPRHRGCAVLPGCADCGAKGRGATDCDQVVAVDALEVGGLLLDPGLDGPLAVGPVAARLVDQVCTPRPVQGRPLTAARKQQQQQGDALQLMMVGSFLYACTGHCREPGDLSGSCTGQCLMHLSSLEPTEFAGLPESAPPAEPGVRGAEGGRRTTPVRLLTWLTMVLRWAW